MTNKTADELILDNAPEGATHYCCGTYCKANKDFFYDWDGEYWCAYFVPDGYMRSLADIAELVELRKKNAELESHNLGLTKTLVEFEQERAIRDLEQKADALDNFKIPEMSYTVFHKVGDALNEQAEELREQAKQLKGGAK